MFLTCTRNFFWSYPCRNSIFSRFLFWVFGQVGSDEYVHYLPNT
uniref:Uncharacterized protein n=1 Tax=Rhizophora mucronata TaxID=61149 RepID=A0A2P2PNL9_RHIMU